MKKAINEISKNTLSKISGGDAHYEVSYQCPKCTGWMHFTSERPLTYCVYCCSKIELVVEE